MRDDDIACLSNLPALFALDLHETALGTVARPWLRRCVRLQALVVSDSPITDKDLDGLADCKQFRQIHAVRCHLDGSFLRVCAGLRNFTKVILDENKRFAGAALANLENHPALECVSLSYTNVADQDIVHLSRIPKLRMLYLPGTRISDNAMRLIAGIKSLEYLSVASTDVTDAGVLLLRGSRKLKWLSLSGTHISGETIRDLQRSLEDVDIDYSYPPARIDA